MLQPFWLTALFVWTMLCLLGDGHSAPDASGPLQAIRVPLRQVKPLLSPAAAAAAAAANQERGNTAKHAVRKRRGAAASGMSFVDMIDNLRGKSGQGYYVEMAVGSPPQKVRAFLYSVRDVRALMTVQFK